MSDAAGDHAGHRIRHLEMIQGVVARMSTSSTLVKRFAVLVTAAAVSFAKLAGEPSILLLSTAIVLIFALLDAGYLGIERSFRALYDDVRSEPPDAPPDFRMSRTRQFGRFFGAAASWSVAGFYLALGGFLVLASALIDGE